MEMLCRKDQTAAPKIYFLENEYLKIALSDAGAAVGRGADTKPAAELCSHDAAIRLRLYTDAPCLVVYSGGFIDKGLPLGPGLETSESCAIALEAQDIPDAPNQHFLPYHIMRAGDVYERNIIYEIIV